MKPVSFGLIAVLLSVVVTSQGQKSRCPNYWTFDSNLFDTRCCADDPFSYGHLTQYSDDCFQSPANSNDSLSTNYWAAFECLIRKAIENSSGDSKELTIINFAEVMTQNLTQSVKEAILSTLIKDNQKNSNLSAIWSKYFDVELEACQVATKSPFPVVHSKFLTWDPSVICGNVTYPDIRTLGRFQATPETKDKIENCDGKFFDSHDFNHFTVGMRKIAILVCDLIGAEIIQEEELNKTLNYEKIFQKMLPRFWSQSVQLSALKLAPKILSPSVHVNGLKITEQEKSQLSFSQVIETLKGLLKKSILDHVTVRTETDEFYANVFILVHMMNHISMNRKYLCDE